MNQSDQTALTDGLKSLIRDAGIDSKEGLATAVGCLLDAYLQTARDQIGAESAAAPVTADIHMGDGSSIPATPAGAEQTDTGQKLPPREGRLFASKFETRRTTAGALDCICWWEITLDGRLVRVCVCF